MIVDRKQIAHYVHVGLHHNQGRVALAESAIMSIAFEVADSLRGSARREFLARCGIKESRR